LGEGFGDGDALALGEGFGEGDGLGEGDALALGEGLGEGDGLGEACGLGDAIFGLGDADRANAVPPLRVARTAGVTKASFAPFTRSARLVVNNRIAVLLLLLCLPTDCRGVNERARRFVGERATGRSALTTGCSESDRAPASLTCPPPPWRCGDAGTTRRARDARSVSS